MNSTIELSAMRLEIHNLVSTDECLIEYLNNVAENDRVDALHNCLQLGARALRFAKDQSETTLLVDVLKSTSESTKTLLQTVAKQACESVSRSTSDIPKKMELLLKSVEKDLNKTLDPDSTSSIVGRLRQALIEGLHEQTNRIVESLDLQNPNSQLGRLGTHFDKRYEKLEAQINTLVAELQASAAASAVRRKTTGKGFTFEDAVEAFIADESRPRRDLVARTSKQTGVNGNDAGDITIEIEKSHAHGPGLNVVIEAKDAQISFPALVRDVEKAMHNRAAAIGLGVTTNCDINRGSSLIVPVGDDKLIVCTPALDDGSYDFIALPIALEMARWKAVMSRVAPTDQMDLNRISSHISAAMNVMGRFVEAKRKLTSVKTTIDDTWNFLDGIRHDLDVELRNLRTAIDEESARSADRRDVA